jgi:penicillin-insensitive murein endopeptidase
MHTGKVRWLALVALAGCARLGVVSDGTSISVGRPSHGYLIEGARLPDRGEGYVTREVWRLRDNRFGTDELIDLVTAVARRMQSHGRDVKLVVADLSGQGGGERLAFHRSHQTGRDVDLLYYMRGVGGQPFEPDAMHAFNAAARATDGTGLTVDIPRTWQLVKELITAPEAPVQWVFMYQPIANLLLAHAQQIGEPEVLIARARRIVRQPSDSARHDDHLHVRVYCSAADRSYGCADIGPMETLAERQGEPSQLELLTAAFAQASSAAPRAAAVAVASTGAAAPAASPGTWGAAVSDAGAVPSGAGAVPAGARAVPAGAGAAAAGAGAVPAGAGAAAPGAGSPAAQASLGRLLRARADWVSIRSWR